MTDLDDIMGVVPPAPALPIKRRPGRPTLAELAARRAAEEAAEALLLPPSSEDTRRPMTIRQLADVTGLDPKTVGDRLIRCPIAEWETVKHGSQRGKRMPKFKFMDAMAYLDDPKIDLERYLFSLSSSTNAHKIPSNLLKGFWDAMNAKAKWEREARHTWNDEDVLEVLGDTAIMIRETSLLWIENLPGRMALTNDDYHALRAQVTDMLEQIKEKLVTLPKLRRTESVVASIDDMLATGEDETLKGAGADVVLLDD